MRYSKNIQECDASDRVESESMVYTCENRERMFSKVADETRVVEERRQMSFVARSLPRRDHVRVASPHSHLNVSTSAIPTRQRQVGITRKRQKRTRSDNLMLRLMSIDPDVD